VFTFGGVGTNENAEVVDGEGTPIPGLYAAGEMTGLYHGDYVGATSVLRGLVFGKIAGEQAVDYVLGEE
jgi:tricarballylate dehydrogenase